MFRVCAVHKFQSYLGQHHTAEVLRLGTKSNAITTRAHLHRLSHRLLNEHNSLCFFQFVKEQCIASSGKTQCIKLTTRSPMQ